MLTDFKKIEAIQSPVPTPGPGQAVVRVRYAGICGSDLHVYDGLHPTAKTPLVMGHEGCGELYAIHDGRSDIHVGDKVCVHTIQPCNSCAACSVGRENLCNAVKIMGTNFDGVFTQYMLVDANRLIRFQDDVDFRLAVLAEPLTVGVHDVRRSGLQAGEDVFIAGAGSIGLLIGMVAEFSGAGHVLFSEIDPQRIQLARAMGFAVASPDASDFQARCDAVTGGLGFDRAFEVTSVQSGFDACLRQLKKGGVMVQVGMPPAGTNLGIDINKIIYSECELRGVRHHTKTSMEYAVKMINSGLLNDRLSAFASVVYPYTQFSEALQRARLDKSVLRVVLDFSSH